MRVVCKLVDLCYRRELTMWFYRWYQWLAVRYQWSLSYWPSSSTSSTGSKYKERHIVGCVYVIIVIIMVFIQQLTKRNHNKLPRRTAYNTGTQARTTRPSTGKCCHKRRKAVTSTAPGRGLVGIQQMATLEHTSDKQAYYSFIDHGRMKGWVGLVGWPVAVMSQNCRS